MLNKSKLNRIAIAVAMSVGMSTAAMAQETSSALSGTVLSTSGQSVANATITVTDTRTGSVKEISSNETGRYNLRGLRVGGPYVVVVKDAAGNTTTESNVYLTLGETKSLNLDLGAAAQIETITVSGSFTNSSYGASGPVANFSLDDLEAAPAINRDIKDLVRIDPRIYIDEGFNDSIQCAGANSRFNSLTVDGIKTNDNFGLGSSGYPTIRIPFSYDSIDQVAVELAPFDVQYGGFTACNINAVTKSGDNEFHGGAFLDYTNDAMRGSSLEGEKLTGGRFNERRYGFNVGGALIEDGRIVRFTLIPASRSWAATASVVSLRQASSIENSSCSKSAMPASSISALAAAGSTLRGAISAYSGCMGPTWWFSATSPRPA